MIQTMILFAAIVALFIAFWLSVQEIKRLGKQLKQKNDAIKEHWRAYNALFLDWQASEDDREKLRVGCNAYTDRHNAGLIQSAKQTVNILRMRHEIAALKHQPAKNEEDYRETIQDLMEENEQLRTRITTTTECLRGEYETCEI